MNHKELLQDLAELQRKFNRVVRAIMEKYEPCKNCGTSTERCAGYMQSCCTKCDHPLKV